MNASCLLGCYTHTLWDSLTQAVPVVPEEARTILSQAIQDGRDVAKFTIHCGLNTTDSTGRAISTSVALRRHAWMWFTVFFGDVQASLMDTPFDGYHLFGDKADSALEHFVESRVTVRSLVMSALSRQPHPQFRPSATVRVFPIANNCNRLRNLLILFMATTEVPTDLMDSRATCSPVNRPSSC